MPRSAARSSVSSSSCDNAHDDRHHAADRCRRHGSNSGRGPPRSAGASLARRARSRRDGRRSGAAGSAVRGAVGRARRTALRPIRLAGEGAAASSRGSTPCSTSGPGRSRGSGRRRRRRNGGTTNRAARRARGSRGRTAGWRRGTTSSRSTDGLARAVDQLGAGHCARSASISPAVALALPTTPGMPAPGWVPAPTK